MRLVQTFRLTRTRIILILRNIYMEYFKNSKYCIYKQDTFFPHLVRHLTKSPYEHTAK